MKVTIVGINNFLKTTEKLSGIDYDLVTIKETKKRNGTVVTNVRVKNGKRAIVFSSGVYHTITIQDEESGRYLLKMSK